ncbi:unnamed protein product [Vitrella brassicaformis CCMP3155]|uniref:Protein kinase domain-containing protein n=2 Tax=Vitrella brassicaformis TaxID=1169539 RepID=A0A0G4G095_VITBC|nr:unnamed protein product [Vitrella brassicaformis CCMP3155]|eukprot:CEM20947.1 unnamed protein product [Vitrella brassicaformis CCMP3155]
MAEVMDAVRPSTPTPTPHPRSSLPLSATFPASNLDFTLPPQHHHLHTTAKTVTRMPVIINQQTTASSALPQCDGDDGSCVASPRSQGEDQAAPKTVRRVADLFWGIRGRQREGERKGAKAASEAHHVSEERVRGDFDAADAWLRRELDVGHIVPVGALTMLKKPRGCNAFTSVQRATLEWQYVDIIWIDARALSRHRHSYMRTPALMELLDNGIFNLRNAGTAIAVPFRGVVCSYPRIGIITEAQGMPLAKFLREYPDVIRVEEHRWSIMEQLARAVESLHCRKTPIMHRDISEHTVMLQWEYEVVHQTPTYMDLKPRVRLRLSHFLYSSEVSATSCIDDPPTGPCLHYMAPEEIVVPSRHTRMACLKSDVWRVMLIFRLLHGLHLNTKDAADEYDLWAELCRLVPVRYGKQEAEYITPLPKMINAMSSLLPEYRWNSSQVLSVLHRPATAYSLPHAPSGLLRSVPDTSTPYPRYDPVVQKLNPPAHFLGGSDVKQPCILIVPHFGRVWGTLSPSEYCDICLTPCSPIPPPNESCCLSCGCTHVPTKMPLYSGHHAAAGPTLTRLRAPPALPQGMPPPFYYPSVHGHAPAPPAMLPYYPYYPPSSLGGYGCGYGYGYPHYLDHVMYGGNREAGA